MSASIRRLILLIAAVTVAGACIGTALGDSLPIPEMSILGDFTITYRVSQKDVSPLVVKQQRQSIAYSQSLNEFYQNTMHQQLAPGTQVSPDIQEEARTQSKRAFDFSCGPLTLTLAQRQKSFLYLLADDQAGRSPQGSIPAMYPRVVLFDGNKSLEHDTTYPHLSVLVHGGLDSQDMDRMPVFCAGTQAFPFFKDLTYNPSLKCYQGNVLDPGNGVGQQFIYYDQNTSVYIDEVNNKPRIKTIIRTDADGQVRQRTDVTAYRLLNGVWIPSSATMTIYNREGPHQRVPFLIVTWSLVDARPIADKALFDPRNYLKKGDNILEEGDARMMSVDLVYDPNISFNEQLERGISYQKIRSFDANTGGVKSNIGSGVFGLLSLMFGVAGWTYWKRRKLHV